jgi:hypothetical protein
MIADLDDNQLLSIPFLNETEGISNIIKRFSLIFGAIGERPVPSVFVNAQFFYSMHSMQVQLALQKLPPRV